MARWGRVQKSVVHVPRRVLEVDPQVVAVPHVRRQLLQVAARADLVLEVLQRHDVVLVQPALLLARLTRQRQQQRPRVEALAARHKRQRVRLLALHERLGQPDDDDRRPGRRLGHIRLQVHPPDLVGHKLPRQLDGPRRSSDVLEQPFPRQMLYIAVGPTNGSAGHPPRSIKVHREDRAAGRARAEHPVTTPLHHRHAAVPVKDGHHRLLLRLLDRGLGVVDNRFYQRPHRLHASRQLVGADSRDVQRSRPHQRHLNVVLEDPPAGKVTQQLPIPLGRLIPLGVQHFVVAAPILSFTHPEISALQGRIPRFIPRRRHRTHPRGKRLHMTPVLLQHLVLPRLHLVQHLLALGVVQLEPVVPVLPLPVGDRFGREARDGPVYAKRTRHGLPLAPAKRHQNGVPPLLMRRRPLEVPEPRAQVLRRRQRDLQDRPDRQPEVPNVNAVARRVRASHDVPVVGVHGHRGERPPEGGPRASPVVVVRARRPRQRAVRSGIQVVQPLRPLCRRHLKRLVPLGQQLLDSAGPQVQVVQPVAAQDQRIHAHPERHRLRHVLHQLLPAHVQLQPDVLPLRPPRSVVQQHRVSGQHGALRRDEGVRVHVVHPVPAFVVLVIQRLQLPPVALIRAAPDVDAVRAPRIDHVPSRPHLQHVAVFVREVAPAQVHAAYRRSRPGLRRVRPPGVGRLAPVPPEVPLGEVVLRLVHVRLRRLPTIQRPLFPSSWLLLRRRFTNRPLSLRVRLARVFVGAPLLPRVPTAAQSIAGVKEARGVHFKANAGFQRDRVLEPPQPQLDRLYSSVGHPRRLQQQRPPSVPRVDRRRRVHYLALQQVVEARVRHPAPVGLLMSRVEVERRLVRNAVEAVPLQPRRPVQRRHAPCHAGVTHVHERCQVRRTGRGAAIVLRAGAGSARAQRLRLEHIPQEPLPHSLRVAAAAAARDILQQRASVAPARRRQRPGRHCRCRPCTLGFHRSRGRPRTLRLR
ncbi:uncharacterized protein BcabD6B2_37560 [Babesia caballi]|uniref:Uncharacterized protein n=1 Tax=Babesia caballi TaxID=5871 RepID=A0AAV4LVX0_BABCB|nr:hypothetical protein BcabD6B2_37560 [Babesia caballi]